MSETIQELELELFDSLEAKVRHGAVRSAHVLERAHHTDGPRQPSGVALQLDANKAMHNDERCIRCLSAQESRGGWPPTDQLHTSLHKQSRARCVAHGWCRGNAQGWSSGLTG